MGELLQPWHLLVILFLLAPISLIGLPPFWMIFKKAGFQPILSVLMLVPLVGLVALYVVGFSKWKGESPAS
jgi:formate hydrogenlyase subunit 3/multisubunit Na+/H+ antiporter MnhD subunit